MTDTPNPAASRTPDPIKSGRSARFAAFRRRGVWAMVITAGVLLLLRVALIFIFPAVLEHVLGHYKLTARYNDIKLDVLGGDAAIWGLKIRPIRGGPDIIDIPYCHGDISIFDLFRGRLYVRRVMADGSNLFVRRSANGNCPLLDALLSHSNGSPSTPVNHNGSKAGISLAAPLRVEAFRIEHLRLHVIDDSVHPAVRLGITLNVRVSHLGRRHGATAFRLDLWSSDFVDVLHINGSLTTRPSALLATSHIFMRGLHLQPAAGYLTALGFRPEAKVLSLSADSTLALHVTTSKPSGQQEIAAHFALNHFILSSGGRPALGIEKLIAQGRLTGNLADVQTVSINGVTLNAGRDKNDRFHFAGLELLRRIATSGKRLVPEVGTPEKGPPIPLHLPGLPKVQLKNAGSYTYSVDRLELHGFKAVFRDAAVTPRAKLQLNINTLEVVSTGGLPGAPGQKLTISGSGAAPGIAGAIDISGGMLPFAQTRTLALHLAASRITCAALAPYLSAAGLKSELKSARFNMDISGAMTTLADGAVAADVHLDHLNYRDGKTTLCDFKHIDVGKVRVNPSTGRLEIGSLDIVGPACDVFREASGHFSVLGLRIQSQRSRPSPVSATAANKPDGTIRPPIHAATLPARVAAAYMPRLQIDHFTWSGIRIGFDDQHATPPTRIGISHAGLVLNHFILDLSGQSAAHGVGTLKAWLQAPGVIQQLDVQGALNPEKRSLQTSLHIVSTGIDLQRLTPYLKPLGILPRLDNGTLSGLLAAHVSLHDGKISGGIQITKLRLRQGAQLLASVGEFRMAHVSARQGEFSAQRVLINQPHLHLTRLRNGNLALCGIELLPKTSAGISTIGIPPSPVQAATPLRAAVKSITLSHAILHWTDHAVFRPVDVRLHANAVITNAYFGHRHPPVGRLQAALSSAALADAIHIRGSFSVPLHALEANIHLRATGLHGRVISSYLPQGIAFLPGGENLSASLHANITHLADGSAAGTLGIGNLYIVRPATASQPGNLLLLPRAAIHFDRLNLPRHVVAIHSIDANLKTIRIDHHGGVWSICGINIGKHLNAQPSGSGLGRASKLANRSFSIIPTHLPLITLTQLNLRAADIVLTGLLPEDQSVNITGLDLRNTAPVRCLGTSPASAPAIALQLTGGVNSIARHVDMAFHLKPFANHPRGKVHMLITGIRGTGLARVIPALARHVDVNALKEGQLSVDGAVALQMDRRSPVDFNFHRQFMATVKVSHLAFTAQPHGPVLAGVAELDAENIKVQPSLSALTIALLNIRTPTIRITRDIAGLHVLGMLLKSGSGMSKAAAEKTLQSALPKVKIKVTMKVVDPGVVNASRSPPPVDSHKHRAKVAPTVGHSGTKLAAVESSTTRAVANHARFPAILIKRLIISGVHARYIDRTCVPQICIPLTGLEAQVHNVGTVPLMKRMPIRFNVIAYAGAVRPLQPRPQSQPLGIAIHAPVATSLPRGSAVRTLDGHQPAGKQGPLFSQFSGDGQIYLYPHPQGWCKTSLNGVYLAELQPLAKQYGVTLSGGTFDSSSDIRFHADNHADIHTKLVFSNLNLSEPPHGFLAKLLNLPAPLNVAIAAVEAPDGSITFPLSVRVKGGNFSHSALTGQFVTDMAQVVAVGIADSPLKLAGGLAGLFGSGKLEAVKEPPVKLGFAPGSTTLTLHDWKILQAMGRRMRRHDSMQVIVRQHISTADIAIAAIRANPTRSQCLQMISALQERHDHLLIQRRQAVGTLRGSLAIRLSRTAITDGTVRVARLDAKIARTQLAMTYIANMLAPGANRDAGRRTRGIMIAIARKRLSEIKAALFAAGFDHPNRRVHIVYPQYIVANSPQGGDAVITWVRAR